MIARIRRPVPLPAVAKKRSKPERRNGPTRSYGSPVESHASDMITVAWTVSVTGVLIADFVVAAAHLFVRNFPKAEPARWLEAIMLFSAAAMGAVSLALLPVVWRTRRVKPPQGYIVFAVLVAIAPIIAMLGRLLA
jgi:hypothetical protein